jgi:hypothetical protein
MPVPFVDTVLSDDKPGEWQPLPDGVLETVTPILPNGDLVPRGRIYVEVQIADKDGMVMQVPWRDYINSIGTTGSAGPTANPCTRVFSSWKVRVVATQTDQGVSVRVGAHLHINTDPDAPSGAGTFHDEPPAQGPGELVVLSLGDPAAGAEYAAHTVAARSRELVRGGVGSLVTSAAVANRRPGMYFDDGAGNQIGGGVTQQVQAASSTVKWVWSIYGPSPTTATTSPTPMTLPEIPLRAGFRVTFTTVNLDAADNWGAGSLVIESWAVPA